MGSEMCIRDRVSSWVFRTIDDQQTEVEDSIDESFDDDYFESGDLL